MPATLTGRTHRDDPPPDKGCWASATCAGCPWKECVSLMAPSERRIFTLAFKTLEAFRAPPDRTVPI